MNVEQLEQQRVQAVLHHDFEKLLSIYVQLVEYYREQDELDQALFNIWCGLSNAEFAQDETYFLKLLEHCVELSPYLGEHPDYQFLLESLVPKFYGYNAKLTSSLYFTLSVIFVKQLEMQQAHDFAKLALFHALKIPQEESQSSLCNAQLQVTLSMLHLGQVSDFEQYVDLFGWHVENCRNIQEQVFCQIIQLLLDFVVGKASTEDMLLYMERLTKSEQSFYPLYLSLHLYLVSCQSEDHAFVAEMKRHYDKLYEQKFMPVAMDEVQLFQEHVLMSGELFFERCERGFQYVLKKGGQLKLVSAHIPKATIGKMKIVAKKMGLLPFYMYMYRPFEFFIVYDQAYETYIRQVLHDVIGHFDCQVELCTGAEEKRFFDLYNKYILLQLHG